MGKGDKRSKRGKLFRGSHGKTIPRKPPPAKPKPEPKPAPAKAARPPREKPVAPVTADQAAAPTEPSPAGESGTSDA